MSDSWFSRIYARPLLPPLAALIGGQVAGLHLPGAPGELPVVMVSLGVLVLLSGKKRIHFWLLILLFFMGHARIQTWIRPELPPNHVSRFADDQRWHVVGMIKGRPQLFAGRTRFVLKTETLYRKGLSQNVCGTIRVTVRGPVRGLRDGDRVACLARLRQVRNFNNPGGFDYRRYLAFRDIRATASVSHEASVVKTARGESNSFTRAVASSRDAVSDLIENATAGRPPASGAVLKALLIGDKSNLSQETRDLFSRIGTSHLLAISGLHVGIVATLAFGFFRFALGRSERLLLGGWASKGAALFSLFPVLCYGFLAGMSPATQRAVIMVAVFLLSQLFERERDAVNTLALAAFVILIINPTALFSLSFQLSFAAVFAILYVLGHVRFLVQLKRRRPDLLTRLALFLGVSAAAILGTLPLSLYYFNQTSLIGLLTNCFLVPLIGFLVVPLGLFSVIVLPVSAAAALWVMKGSALILALAMDLAGFFSKSPLAAVKTVTPTLIEMVLYYALAWAVLNFRRAPWTRILLLGVSVLLLADAGYWIQKRFGRRQLKVTVIDVGQGSSTLLQFPGGPCMLVDGGGFHDNRFDMGARVVAPVLWKKKIASVDILVLSHPHPDHLNGLVFIARNFKVGEVWMTLESIDTRPYRELMQVISEKGIRVLGPKELIEPRTIGGVRIETLYPPVDFLARRPKEVWRTANNNSLVLKVSFKEVSFLLPGDVEAEAEKELAGMACDRLKSRVLVVPHHGSRGSSTPLFLNCVSPDFCIMSLGWKNIFRFPHEEVLRRYEAMGCDIYRTDLHGAVTMATEGRGLVVEPFLR